MTALRFIVLSIVCVLVEVYSQQTYPYVSFMSQTLANHSYVDITTVGNGSSDSVQCITDLTSCCTGAQSFHRGDWYFPNGDRLQFSDSGDIYEQRDDQRVELRRQDNANSPTGIYRCDIPTNAVHHDIDISVRDTFYVGLYIPSAGSVIISESLSLTVESDLNGPSPQFTLTCISTGGPATNVTWTRDSTILTEGNETVLNDPETANYTHTLTVTGKQPGLYTCTVSNNKPSNASKSIRVGVLQIEVTQMGNASISLSWSVSGHSVISSEVMWKSLSGTPATGSSGSILSVTNYTVDGLQPLSVYNISLNVFTNFSENFTNSIISFTVPECEIMKKEESIVVVIALGTTLGVVVVLATVVGSISLVVLCSLKRKESETSSLYTSKLKETIPNRSSEDKFQTTSNEAYNLVKGTTERSGDGEGGGDGGGDEGEEYYDTVR